ncbi:hypothetical protein GH984_04845 [Spiribacter sp. C176]|uniref:Periplasmic heavy metal sensor n=1 Tax=Spiribacter salilacus TaxID=2664894 RepID=A0A6N7QUM4_9GAMM|nr:hypothetical protein [Spiribacter salilacus]MRH78027.1 hypothetical protein [Spiribacter salilacus]
MKTVQRLLIALMLIAPPSLGSAQHAHSPYSGQENRAIKSLSEDDLAELRRGGGWGLALAAELNGVPGPTHLMELADEIELEDNQQNAINDIYERMRTRAIEAGERFIEAEASLEAAFQSGQLSPERLREHLDTIAQRRSDLRYAHLAAHLETMDVISPNQVKRYNKLRGYDASSACDDVPDGHDPAMWRRHNGC